jgi:hypothetical protein
MTSTATPDIRLGDLRQGDLRLLTDPLAQRLLNGAELGRLGYVALDGTPRVIPVGFVWTGTAVVLATFRRSPKIAALRARPDVALTVDRPGPPPELLSLRGTITVDDVDGVPEVYRAMQEQYYGPEQAAATVEALTRSGAQMSVLTLRPTWVGLLDFQTRLPSALAPDAA